MRALTPAAIAAVLLFPTSAFAAMATVSVDTGAEEINALEGTVVLPEGMRVSQVEAGNSAILFWVAAPRLEGNSVTFAGITPGGFTGARQLLTLRGDFSAEDLANVRFGKVEALANDGTGARVPVTLSISMAPFRVDSAPPEDFVPTIARDPDIFDGKYFLVFATQDKGSGIDYYEVREGRFGRWREAESPYLLTDQGLDKDVYVRATDNAGNERVVVVPAIVHRAWLERYGLFAIFSILIVAAIIYKRAWVRFIK